MQNVIDASLAVSKIGLVLTRMLSTGTREPEKDNSLEQFEWNNY